MSIKRDLRHAKQQTLEQLTALRDEAKVRLHLLSLDARQRWNELEKQIGELEARANLEGEKAAESVKLAARELTLVVDEFVTSQLSQANGLSTAVRTVMSSHVRTCHSGDSLDHAAHLLWDGDCGALPVLFNGTAVSVITDRDICMAVYTQGKPAAQLQVESAMSKELFSCSPDASIGDALAAMGARRVRRLAVLDAGGELMGMIALADVARWARAIKNPAVDAALVDALGAISAFTPQKLHAAAE